MTWFSNLRLMPRLIGSFVLVAFLATMVGGAGYLGLRSQNSQVTLLSTVSIPNMISLLDTQRDLNVTMRYGRGAVLEADHACTQQYADKQAAERRDAQGLADPIGAALR
jgi:hypothetical protein